MRNVATPRDAPTVQAQDNSPESLLAIVEGRISKEPAVADVDFSTVTELPGTKVSRHQVQLAVNRYSFAAEFCRNKDVLELACGAGIGLGILKRNSRGLVAGDIDQGILEFARRTHGDSMDLRSLDAQSLPFDDNSFDVVILFEAIYYLTQPERFVREARRVLRDNGTIIVCNPNKDLPDFNPSPFSHRYFNAPDFCDLFGGHAFEIACYGDLDLDRTSLKGRLLALLKRWAVSLRLIPRTMKGKVLLKRLLFGRLLTMPAQLVDDHWPASPLNMIEINVTDKQHEIIFCVAKKVS